MAPCLGTVQVKVGTMWHLMAHSYRLLTQVIVHSSVGLPKMEKASGGLWVSLWLGRIASDGENKKFLFSKEKTDFSLGSVTNPGFKSSHVINDILAAGTTLLKARWSA